MDLIDVWWSYWMVVRLLHVAINQMIESDWRIVLSCPSLVFLTVSVKRKEPEDVGFHPLSNFLLAFAFETWFQGWFGEMDNLIILFGWFLHGLIKTSEAWGSSCDWQMNGSSNTWLSLLLWFVVLVILYKCKMNGGLGCLRLEAAGALRTALVSAENLQLTLKSDLSLEEQALTNNHSSGNGEKPSKGYEKCHGFHAQQD